MRNLPDKEIKKMIQGCLKYKPENLMLDDVNWKFLFRSVLREKNIMLVGHHGCGKTVSAQAIQEVFSKHFGSKFFTFNMGATQDPRVALIGNTHLNKDGTLFNPSKFVRAIQTENAIILLDEMSRISDDASNILMSVLDYKQRYLSLDESIEQEIIKVADGVSFISTANIGIEYTSARVMDRALLDRFTLIEIPTLNLEQESKLIEMKYPNLSENMIRSISNLSVETRDEVLYSDDSELSTIISTRMALEMASLINDGFTFKEAAQSAILPFYPTDGGNESERTMVKQKVQANVPTEEHETDIGKGIMDGENSLFTLDDMNKSTKRKIN